MRNPREITENTFLDTNVSSIKIKTGKIPVYMDKECPV